MKNGITDSEALTLLKIKSLLNHLEYFIKEDHLGVVGEYHELCRKHCTDFQFRSAGVRREKPGKTGFVREGK